MEFCAHRCLSLKCFRGAITGLVWPTAPGMCEVFFLSISIALRAGEKRMNFAAARGAVDGALTSAVCALLVKVRYFRLRRHQPTMPLAIDFRILVC